MFMMRWWDVPGEYQIFKKARLADIEEISENMYNLSILLYVHNGKNGDGQSLKLTIEAWMVGCIKLRKQLWKLFIVLPDIGIEV